MTSFMSIGRHRISRLSVTLLPLSLAHGNVWASCARRYSGKVLTASPSINQNLIKLRYEVRGSVAKRADKITEDLKVCCVLCITRSQVAGYIRKSEDLWFAAVEKPWCMAILKSGGGEYREPSYVEANTNYFLQTSKLINICLLVISYVIHYIVGVSIVYG